MKRNEPPILKRHELPQDGEVKPNLAVTDAPTGSELGSINIVGICKTLREAPAFLNDTDYRNIADLLELAYDKPLTSVYMRVCQVGGHYEVSRQNLRIFTTFRRAKDHDDVDGHPVVEVPVDNANMDIVPVTKDDVKEARSK
jgi:hypothetical protein